jgi:hypothetical protein
MNWSVILESPSPKARALKCYPWVAHPQVVQSKRFTRINPLKSYFSGSPSMKDVQKRFNLESKNPQTGTPQSLIFAETPSQATPNASKANLFKTRNECMSSKNSSKAIKFDKCRQPLVLRCVSRLGVASQASFVPNERPQGKNERIQHAASLKV